MVNKLISERIYEICLVLIMVAITIPVWNNFAKHISQAELTTLDDYNLEFNLKNNLYSEQIEVNNPYTINKNYKIYLKVNKDIIVDNSILKINEQEHSLNEFNCQEKKDYYLYTIIADNIILSNKSYFIEPMLRGNSINYSYIFEEQTIF